MAINLPIPKKNLKIDGKTSSSVMAELDQLKESQANTEVKNPPGSLLKASQDAELAKTAVRKAINQAFKEREESLQKAGNLAQAFDEAIQSHAAQKSQISSQNAGTGTLSDSTDSVKRELAQKVLNNSAATTSPFSDIIKAYFGNKLDSETKKDINNLATSQNKNLRQVIEHVTDDQAHKKAAKIIGEAKSDRVASKLVFSQAQEEIKKAREEAEMIKRTADEAVHQAREEADVSRKDAEEAIDIARGWIEQAKNEVATEKKSAALIASQARQQAMSQTAEEIKKAKDEVKAAKEAANTAVRLAKEEIARSREEAETYKKNAQAAIAALEEKIFKVVEKVKAIKQQSLISISEAQAEAQKANEAAAITRRECQSTIEQARMESQKASEEAKLEIMKARESVIKSEQQAYDQVREKMEQVKREAEISKQAAYEAVTRAREEASRAKGDAEVVKKASEDAVFKALEQRRKSEEETEKAKQVMLEFANKAQEESRKAREEAESAIMRANEVMMQAQQDIIGMTINEITATRQELEEAVNNPDNLVNNQPEESAPDAGQTEKLDPDLMTAVLHEMRAPLHSISGFARLMLEDDVTDGPTRKEFLSIVVQQSETLTRLLDDLSGKLEPDDTQPAADVSGQTA
jgi:hypothetical protein